MSKPNRIVILTPVWRRPAITEICFAGINRLREYKPEHYEIKPLAVISENEMKGLCKRYEIPYTFFENLPLGKKKNHGLQQLMKKNWDWLIELGSDDLVLNELLDLYFNYRADYMAIKNFLYLDSTNNDCRQYSSETVFGVGRMYSREAVEKSALTQEVIGNDYAITNYGSVVKNEISDFPPDVADSMIKCNICKKHGPVKYKLWKDGAMRGMDNYANAKLNRQGYSAVQLFTEHPMAVDIKSKENLWKFNKEIGFDYNFDDFKTKLSDKEIDLLQCLH